MARDGGAAFPSFELQRTYVDDADRLGRMTHVPVGGMSLRDYFAAQVVGAYLYERFSGNHTWEPREIAEWSYELADAMLAEREKVNGHE